MLEAIALVAIVTAAITSTFVDRATHLQDVSAAQDEKHREAEVERRFDDLAERLDRLETMLRDLVDRDAVAVGPRGRRQQLDRARRRLRPGRAVRRKTW